MSVFCCNSLDEITCSGDCVEYQNEFLCPEGTIPCEPGPSPPTVPPPTSAGTLPPTGTEISMGMVRAGYGLSGEVGLLQNLGPQIGISFGTIGLSVDFGGRSTPFSPTY